MEEVAGNLHLQKRGETWHYYRRVPKHLVALIGKQFIKRSLGVTKLADAKRLRTIEDLKADALFASAEKGKMGQCAGAVGSSDISLAMLIEHVRATIGARDSKSAESLAVDPPEDHEQLAEMRRDAEIALNILTSPADPRRDGAAC